MDLEAGSRSVEGSRVRGFPGLAGTPRKEQVKVSFMIGFVFNNIALKSTNLGYLQRFSRQVFVPTCFVPELGVPLGGTKVNATIWASKATYDVMRGSYM